MRYIGIVFILAMLSCSSTPEITGNWIYADVEILDIEKAFEKELNELPEAQQAARRNQLKEMVDKIKKDKVKALSSNEVHFKAGGAIVSIDKGKQKNGKWKLDANQKKLNLSIDGNTVTLNVVEISENKLVISSKEEGVTVRLILRRL